MTSLCLNKFTYMHAVCTYTNLHLCMHVQIELQSGAFLYCRCDKQIKTRLYSMATVALDILHTFIMFHGTYLTTVFVDYFSLLLPGLLKARGFLSQGGLAFHAIPAPSSHCFFPWGLCGCIGSWATGQDKTDGHIPNYGGGMCDGGVFYELMRYK